MLRIYNTLSRTKEIFTPHQAGKVAMYVCGITVYDYCHIGHARMMVVFDVVQRWLRALGYQVTYVRNITDIDDKIIRRAVDQGIGIGELTARYIAAMYQDLDALRVQRPDHEPRATQFVPQMLGIIRRLVDQGFAYQVAPDFALAGDVHFAVRKFAPYGRLSGRTLDDLRAGERVKPGEGKLDPLDFVLWKSSKEGEPSEAIWESEFGQGRPGWHIECSAMSESILGTPIDIHGGGADLQFPHHENEIAQSEGAMEDQKHPFVRYWMHNGFVRVDNEKMSKSLGNFFTIREVVDQFDPEVLRLYILRAHYRSPLNYSDAHLDDARLALLRLYGALSTTAEASSASMMPATSYSLSDQASDGLSAHWQARFAEAMNDDFNTPVGVAVLFDLAAEVYRAREHGDEPRAIALEACLRAFAKTLGLLDQDPALVRESGLLGQARRSAALGDEAIEAMVSERGEAKKARDFQRADRLRDELGKAGIVLEDSPQGTRWRRQ